MRQPPTNPSVQPPDPNPTPSTSEGPSSGKSWVSEYYDAVKAGFMRVWLNKYLWFWGIFLPTGLGLNANYNFNSQDFSDGDKIDNFARSAFLDSGSFFAQYWVWIIAVTLLFLLLILLFWALSAIARAGVINALDALQNPTQGAVHTFQSVWTNGKQRFWQVMLVDVVVGFSMLLILLVLAAPIVMSVVQGRYVSAALLGLLAILIYLPLVFLSMFLRQVAVVVTVLAKVPVLSSIERSYLYVRKNLKESLKLLLTMVILGVVQGLAAFLAVLPLVIIVVGVVLLLVGLSGGNIFNDPASRTWSIVAASFVVLVMLAILLLIKSIFALWVQDLWLWWTKKVGSVMSVETEKDDRKIKVEDTIKGKAFNSLEEN